MRAANFLGLLDDFRIVEGVALPPDPADQDGDGLTDAQELAIGTDPLKWDTDNGGVSDGFEVVFTGSDPWRAEKISGSYSSELGAFIIPSVSAFSFCLSSGIPPLAPGPARRPLHHAGTPAMIT